ncbi:MAG: hypothetical protein ACOX4J_02500 [Anaerovoracaceae bacterium]|jgi:hypothetical protein
MENRSLYIVLTRTNTFISRLIHVLKNDEYTHAAIALDRELEYMYSFGRKYALNPFLGGFKREEINKGLYKLYRNVPCLIIEVQVTAQQHKKAQALLSHFIANRYLYKYNYMGLFYGFFQKTVCRDHRFLCSEFVYYVLKESGIVDFRISRNLVRPQNLLEVKGEIIYKGNLNDLRPKFTSYSSFQHS